ncbi:MAG: menaquinol oxidoreductase [Blastocatellia bacterium AA13]|nr:MAG: menaquinol oxidoreductase [Blastocatellia bacterium AA13]
MRSWKVVLILLALAAVSVVFLSGIIGKPFEPAQPIAFDHWQHTSKQGEDTPKLECTDCHENADKSRFATIPNVSKCMICHETMKTESPEIQKLAAYSSRSEQPPWKRVYWIEKEADVFFTHKPHIRAGVDCTTCHGQVNQMHRVKRDVDHSMGWCIQCHRENRVSVDCSICHR